MKRRLICLVVTLSVTASLLLSGCGGTSAQVQEESAPTEEVTVEAPPEVTEEATVEVTSEVAEEVAEQPADDLSEEEFNQDIAMQKVERAIDCYRQLLSSNDEATWNIIDSIERFGQYKYYLDLETKDNYPVYSEGSGTITDIPLYAMGTVYYEYINGISDEVPVMSEYIPSKTLDEIKDAYNYKECVDDSVDVDKTMMFAGMILVNCLNLATEIETASFEKLDAPLWEINDSYDIVYKLSLIVDEEPGLFVCFDEKGMLIQIEIEDDADYDKFIIKTFPEEE